MVDLPAPDRPVNQRIAGFWCLSRACASRVTVRPCRWTLVARRSPWAIMPAPAVALVMPVDQDERAGVAVVGVGVPGDRHGGREIAEADLVEVEPLGGELVEIVDVEPMLEFGDGGRDGSRPDLHQVRAPRQHRIGAHPDDVGGELVGDLRTAVRMRQHVAAGDVEFVGERQRDGVAGLGAVDFRVGGQGSPSRSSGGRSRRRRSRRPLRSARWRSCRRRRGSRDADG